MKGDGLELLLRLLPPVIYFLALLALVLGVVSIVQWIL